LPAAVAALPAAIEFLTPIRVNVGAPLSEAAIGSSSAYFPIVGLLLGLALLGLDRVLASVLPVAAGSAVLVALLAVVTGFLHLDGLADTADGLLGGDTPARRLAIMRDSRIGAFGAAALVLVLLLQWTAIASLVPPWRGPGLVLFPTLGRTAMVAAIAAFPYARSQGLGVVFRRHIWPWAAPSAAVLSVGFALLCFGVSGIALWGAALLTTAILGFAIWPRLGGLTGDTYGAICELSQIVILLLIVSGHQTGWLGLGILHR
jgi:adenosylcobinamide-GDP ribazoletransferase